MIEIISYWFFVWFLLFIFGIIKQNPFWVLVISYIITQFELAYLVVNHANQYNVTKFVIINMIIKFIPILCIFVMAKYKIPILKTNDIIFTIFIIFLYIIILDLFGLNVTRYYQDMLNSYITDDEKNRTPISRIYDSMFRGKLN